MTLVKGLAEAAGRGTIETSSMLSLEDLRPAWHADAACKGKGNAAFFQAHQAQEAKKLCATCPSVVPCLEASLLTFGDFSAKERHGIWGGAGGQQRRLFKRLHKDRPHAEPGPVADCACAWCVELARHLDQISSGHATGASSGVAIPNRNGPRARHGLRVTFNRGCRCDACGYAASQSAQRLARQGVDTSDWWHERFEGISMDDPVVAAAARLVGGVEAMIQLGELSGSSELGKSARRLRAAMRAAQTDADAA